MGRERREVWAKPGKSVEEVEDGCAELTFGAVAGGGDNLLAQVLPAALYPVQIERIRGQKHVAHWRIDQPSPQFLVFVVADGVALAPLAAINDEQGPLLAHSAPRTGVVRVVGEVGRVGVLQARFASLDRGFEHSQFVQRVLACAPTSAW